MSIVIHKQALKPYAEYQDFNPHGEVRRILDIQLQNGIHCLWYEFNPEAGPSFQTQIQVMCVGTGHEVPPQPFTYVSTIQEGRFVWHWYAKRVFLP